MNFRIFAEGTRIMRPLRATIRKGSAIVFAVVRKVTGPFPGCVRVKGTKISGLPATAPMQNWRFLLRSLNAHGNDERARRIVFAVVSEKGTTHFCVLSTKTGGPACNKTTTLR